MTFEKKRISGSKRYLLLFYFFIRVTLQVGGGDSTIGYEASLVYSSDEKENDLYDSAAAAAAANGGVDTPTHEYDDDEEQWGDRAGSGIDYDVDFAKFSVKVSDLWRLGHLWTVTGAVSNYLRGIPEVSVMYNGLESNDNIRFSYEDETDSTGVTDNVFSLMMIIIR